MGIQNRAGALYMATGIDNSGLYTGLNQATNKVDQFEAHIRRVGDNITRITGVGFGVMGLKALGSEIINVRNQFQQLEIAFGTMLKSEERAARLMSELQTFAANTPFGLDSAATGAKQLIAYGSAAEDVIGELTMLGDVAAGTGQQISELVYLYGTLRMQGQAYLMDIRQFAGRGIPIYKELAEVLKINESQVNEFVSAGKVGFKEVEQAFKNMTSQGGLYGGLMEKQSESIGGRLEALKDNLDAIFNQIGKDNEGVIYNSIDGLNTLVENYETVGKVLLGLVTTYGAYKTALITINVLESYRASRVVPDLAMQTLGFANATKTLTIAQWAQAKAQAALGAVSKVNPYVLAAAAVIGLVTAVWALHDSTTTQEKAQKRLNEITEEAAKRKQELEDETSRLTGVINSETKSIYDQIVAYRELQGKYQGLLKNMSLQEFQSKSVTEQQRMLNAAMNEMNDKFLDDQVSSLGQSISLLEKQIGTMQIRSAGEADFKAQLEDELKQKQINLNKLKEQVKERDKIKDQAEFLSLSEEEQHEILNKNLSSLEKQREELEHTITSSKNLNTPFEQFDHILQSNIGRLNGVIDAINKIKQTLSRGTAPVENKSFWEKQKKDAESALAAMEKSEKGGKKWNEQLRLLDKANANLKVWDFSNRTQRNSDSSVENARKQAQEIADQELKIENDRIKAKFELRDMELKNEQAVLDNQQDGFDKQQKQNELNYKKESLALERHIQNLIETAQKAERDEWNIKNPKGSKTPFKTKINSVSDLPDVLQTQIIQTDVNNNQAYVKSTSDTLKSLLDLYRDYNEQRRSINEEYGNNLAVLEAQRSKAATDEDKNKIDVAIGELKKKWSEALSSINLDELKDQIDWEVIFGDLDSVSTKALSSLRDKIEKALPDLSKSLSPTDLKTVSDALDRLNGELSERKPINELKDSYKEYTKTCKDVAEAQKLVNKLKAEGKEGTEEYANAVKKLADAEDDSADARVRLANNMTKVVDRAQEYVNTGKELLYTLETMGVKVSESMKQALTGIEEIIEGAGTLSEGIKEMNVAKIAEGAIVQTRGYYNLISGIFSSNKQLSERTIKEYENLMSVLDDVIDKYKELLDVSAGKEAIDQSDAAREAIERQIEATQRLGKEYFNTYKKGQGHSRGWHARKNLAEFKDELEELGYSWDELNKKDFMEGLFDLDPEDLENIKTNIHGFWAKLDDQTRTYLEQIIASGEALDEINSKEKEILAGVSFDGLRDGLKSFIMDADSDLEDLANNFEQYMLDALSNMVLQDMNDELEAWYKDYTDALKEGEGHLTEDQAAYYRDQYIKLGEDAKDRYQAAKDNLGLDFDEDTRTSEAKGIATASQDSVDYLNGMMTISVEHTRQIVGFTGNISEQLKMLSIDSKAVINTCSSILMHTANIDANTISMNEKLGKMQSDINSILLNGITVKK